MYVHNVHIHWFRFGVSFEEVNKIILLAIIIYITETYVHMCVVIQL